ncbi:MAG: hypothetical protein AVDCRST_MAG96-409 [uncultured Segetibacter sp.]|uniref:Uncharacterized protein n=1 Tax=uncultured Segetibacter sp. TaxID=481133 RepID=A0A6J4RK27_9BACT|nr:MAG: hypothetical protein AVDCRST_MAG96-409 [uncultured Segetibacter sp.]
MPALASAVRHKSPFIEGLKSGLSYLNLLRSKSSPGIQLEAKNSNHRRFRRVNDFDSDISTPEAAFSNANSAQKSHAMKLSTLGPQHSFRTSIGGGRRDDIYGDNIHLQYDIQQNSERLG